MTDEASDTIETAAAPDVAVEEAPARPFRHSWLTTDGEADPVELAAPEPAAPERLSLPRRRRLVAKLPHDDTAARFAALEARIEEQDAALRRVLTLMVDWMDTEQAAAPAAAVEEAPVTCAGVGRLCAYPSVRGLIRC